MWRSVGLLVVVVLVVLAVRNSQQGPGEHLHVYSITVPYGTTTTLGRGSIGYPFTIRCPKPTTRKKGSGLTQVIRTPLPADKTSIFGDAMFVTTIRATTTASGATRLSCS
jgi:hypothetical protein